MAPRLLTPSKPPVFVDPNHCVPKVWLDPMLGALRSQQAGQAWPKRPATVPMEEFLSQLHPPPRKTRKLSKNMQKQKQLELVCVCVCVCYWKGYIPPGHPLILIYFRRKLWSKSFSKPRRSELADCPIWEVGQRVQLLSTDKKRRSKWQNQTQWFDVPTIKNNESLCHGMVWIFLLSSAHMQKQHHVYYIHIIWDKFRPLKKKTLWFGVFRPVSGVLFEPAAAWTHGSRIKWPELYTPEN